MHRVKLYKIDTPQS